MGNLKSKSYEVQKEEEKIDKRNSVKNRPIEKHHSVHLPERMSQEIREARKSLNFEPSQGQSTSKIVENIIEEAQKRYEGEEKFTPLNEQEDKINESPKTPDTAKVENIIENVAVDDKKDTRMHNQNQFDEIVPAKDEVKQPTQVAKSFDEDEALMLQALTIPPKKQEKDVTHDVKSLETLNILERGAPPEYTEVDQKEEITKQSEVAEGCKPNEDNLKVSDAQVCDKPKAENINKEEELNTEVCNKPEAKNMNKEEEAKPTKEEIQNEAHSKTDDTKPEPEDHNNTIFEPSAQVVNTSKEDVKSDCNLQNTTLGKASDDIEKPEEANSSNSKSKEEDILVEDKVTLPKELNNEDKVTEKFESTVEAVIEPEFKHNTNKDVENELIEKVNNVVKVNENKLNNELKFADQCMPKVENIITTEKSEIKESKSDKAETTSTKDSKTQDQDIIKPEEAACLRTILPEVEKTVEVHHVSEKVQECAINDVDHSVIQLKDTPKQVQNQDIFKDEEKPKDEVQHEGKSSKEEQHHNEACEIEEQPKDNTSDNNCTEPEKTNVNNEDTKNDSDVLPSETEIPKSDKQEVKVNFEPVVAETPTDNKQIKNEASPLSEDQPTEEKQQSDHGEKKDNNESKDSVKEEAKDKSSILISIQEIEREIKELKVQILHFSGTSQDTEFLTLRELLIRNIIKLDDISMENNDEIRNERKRVIKFAQQCLSDLERKVENSKPEKSENSDSE